MLNEWRTGRCQAYLGPKLCDIIWAPQIKDKPAHFHKDINEENAFSVFGHKIENIVWPERKTCSSDEHV